MQQMNAAFADLTAKLAAHFGGDLARQHFTCSVSPCVDESGRPGVLIQAIAASRSPDDPNFYGYALRDEVAE